VPADEYSIRQLTELRLRLQEFAQRERELRTVHQRLLAHRQQLIEQQAALAGLMREALRVPNKIS
jgi:hypothetical protein